MEIQIIALGANYFELILKSYNIYCTYGAYSAVRALIVSTCM